MIAKIRKRRKKFYFQVDVKTCVGRDSAPAPQSKFAQSSRGVCILFDFSNQFLISSAFKILMDFFYSNG